MLTIHSLSDTLTHRPIPAVRVARPNWVPPPQYPNLGRSLANFRRYLFIVQSGRGTKVCLSFYFSEIGHGTSGLEAISFAPGLLVL